MGCVPIGLLQKTPGMIIAVGISASWRAPVTIHRSAVDARIITMRVDQQQLINIDLALEKCIAMAESEDGVQTCMMTYDESMEEIAEYEDAESITPLE